MFERARYQSHPCHVARHPLLLSYIGALVSGVRSVAALHAHTRVIVAISDDTQRRCMERFVFDARTTAAAQFASAPRAASEVQSLHGALSSCLAHLNACNALLAPLPPAARPSFTLLLCTQQQQQQHRPGQAQAASDNWLAVDVSASATALSAHSSDAALPLLVPLRSLRHQLLELELYIEESVDKLVKAPTESEKFTATQTI